MAASHKFLAFAPDSNPSFTPREVEVLRLLAMGLLQSEIGRRLGISEGTAKLHVAHMLKKFGLRNSPHLVDFAHRHHVI